MFRYITFTLVLVLIVITASVVAQDRSLVIINGLGETMDEVNLVSGSANLDVATLGLYPNDVLVNGDKIYVINSGSDEVQIFDRNAFTPLGTVFLGGGRNPWSGAFLSADTLYVTNFVTSTISKVDIASQSVISEFPVGDAMASDSPEGILIKDRKAFVCLTSFDNLFNYDDGKLEVYDLDADTLLKVIEVGINSQWVTEGYDGYLYVISTGNYADVEGWLYKIDPDALTKVDSLFLGGSPSSIAITKQGVAFIAAGGFSGGGGAGGQVYTVDLGGWQILHGPADPLETDFGVVDVLTVSDSTVVSCNFDDDTVTEIDSTGTVLQRFNVGDGPTAAAKSPECFVVKGDADVSGDISIGDAVYIINYIFGGGPPSPVSNAGDADCSGGISIGDAVYIINYIFGGGPLCGECAD